MANQIAKIFNSVSLKVKNFQLVQLMGGVKGSPQNIPIVEDNAHKPSAFIIPLQLERVKQDVATWRIAIGEAENAYYPHRFRMQQMFVDTVLEGHTFACIQTRKDMTLLKGFKVGKKNAEGVWVENKETSQLFQDKKWFNDLLGYILDAQFFGYSLIQLGDLESSGKEYNFKNLTIIKRWHVSPDRKQLVQIPYQTWGLNISDKTYFSKGAFESHDKQNGVSFTEDCDANGVPYNDWMLYVDTPSEVGTSICGFGLLYNVSIYSILLRNNLTHNADYNQMFVAPYRHIKTNEKFDSAEYKNLMLAASQMGNNGFLLTSKEEEVDFIQANNGTGYTSYADLERRCQAMISKMILGHANALDAQTTSLGGGGTSKKTIDEDSTPEGKAKMIVEKRQDLFVSNILNNLLYYKLKKLGFPLKDGECFYTLSNK